MKVPSRKPKARLAPRKRRTPSARLQEDPKDANTKHVACLAGTFFLFRAVPKTFLPLGDSGFIWGVLIAENSASPQHMRSYQDEADKVLQANPAVATTFTMTALRASGVTSPSDWPLTARRC